MYKLCPALAEFMSEDEKAGWDIRYDHAPLPDLGIFIYNG